MENSKQTNGSFYFFDDVVVERDNFRIRKDGGTRSLTPRAFDVLVYLIEQPGRVVEKQELFEAIWKETFVTDNALTRAVKEIRRELGDDANSPLYIETVHKRGYRFIADVKSSTDDANSTPSAILIADLEAEEERGEQVTEKNRTSRLTSLNGLWTVSAIGLLIAAALAYWFFGSSRAKPIESIAVMPFRNESDSPDMEYLSDGMTESLIGSLSQLRNLNVKARSSVFRYKGKDTNAQIVGKELNVQAILTGRVVLRGEDITLYLSLIDSQNENNIWSRQYNRKLANLITLQSEIARDVALGLGTKLSGADVQKVTKSYTENVEAYQLYLKGRYHVLTTRYLGAETGISYYRQATDLDPNYALAYAGLAEAGVALAFGSEMPASEVFTKAKAAANRAVEIDGELAEAHVAIAFIGFYYDWDWNASENHIRRALELNANNADAHLTYGIMLCSAGRHEEGLAELKRAIELEPLNLRNQAVEGQYLNFAGRTDEALIRLQKTLEMEPNFYLAHLLASSAYAEKGMFAEAIVEARTARKLNPVSSVPIAFLGYALGKSGKQDESRVLLEQLLLSSKDRYVTPISIAMIYNSLGERDEALAWLKRGVEQRDLRVTFLKVEPKWNNLRDDPRFQDLMQRVGLP